MAVCMLRLNAIADLGYEELNWCHSGLCAGQRGTGLMPASLLSIVWT